MTRFNFLGTLFEHRTTQLLTKPGCFNHKLLHTVVQLTKTLVVKMSWFDQKVTVSHAQNVSYEINDHTEQDYIQP